MAKTYPDWVVLHIPHDSKIIPREIRAQFALQNDQLAAELTVMTDEGTRVLFNAEVDHKRLVYAKVSRLVVDVERFEEDEDESMVQKGMGVIYTKTAQQQTLRHPISRLEREELLKKYYRPHHRELEKQVDEVLQKHGRCLVLDCHSFPSTPQPYEDNQKSTRPDICIGTDPYHTTDKLEQNFVQTFTKKGFKVSINEPFSGALVSIKHYERDNRVQAVMVEVNRKLYMDENTGKLLEGFKEFATLITEACRAAIVAELNQPLYTDSNRSSQAN
jgi:N-formylglutamate deformylase